MIIGVHSQSRAYGGHTGNDLVRIHVRARARPGLEHVDRELLVMSAGGNLASDTTDHRSHVSIQQAEFGIDHGCGGLDACQRANERSWQAQATDREISHGPLRLSAIHGICRNTQLTQRVMFYAVSFRHRC